MNATKYKFIKFQSGSIFTNFTPILLLLGFLGSNAYYISAMNYLHNIVDRNPFSSSRYPSVEYSSIETDIQKKFLAKPKLDVQSTDAMVVCDYWRKLAKKEDSWPNRVKSNEECINALLQHLAEIENKQ